MDLHVGLDVSLDETSICIVHGEGRRQYEAKVPTDPDLIGAALPNRDNLKRIGIEASSIGIWLARELLAAELPVIVVETRHMHSSLSAMRNKTDRNDALGIAQMMRLGWFRAVHVKGIANQRLRTLLANRKLLKRKLVDLQNHIRGALRAYGLRVGPIAAGKFESRVRTLMTDEEHVFQAMIEHMLTVRAAILEACAKLHTLVLNYVANDPLCRRFMTAPGVGPITALSFKSAIDDPHRFRRSRAVGAHFGLTPRRHQSGTIDWTGRVTKMGDVSMRGALCDAAAALLMRVQSYSALKAWGMRIAKRTSMMCAIVAVARKLAVILHRMWIDGNDFEWRSGAKIVAKRKCDPKTGLVLSY